VSTEAWERAEQIFTEARAISPDARAAFVDRSCGADESLRCEVRALLDAEAQAGSFLEQPALDSLAATVASDGWRLQRGERIGAYTVVRLLGSGGAGEVWRARDERLGRDVAIKVMLPHSSTDPERLRRFADEARTAGALNHTNVLTVYDVGEHRGIPYLVSECLEGQSLRQRIDAGPLRIDDAVSVALGIARGLAAAHARGIIHRDLKPENTFIRADGIVKILDFGLAKLQSSLEELRGASTHTVTGVILGTAGYMSPEQIRSEAVDGRSDLFSVGVILYEMLTGRNPFRGASTFETLHAVLTADPPDLADSGVPPGLAGITMRLLSKSPDARFQSALDLAWALEQGSGRLVGAVTRAPVVAGGRPPEKREWVWLAAAAGAAAAVLLPWSLLGRPTPALADPALAQFAIPLPPDTVLRSAPAVSPDGRHIAFAAADATTRRLYVHALASRDATPVPGSEGAMLPFWSTDGTALGFFGPGRSGLQLMTASWPGGAPTPVASAFFPLGATWSSTGTILLAPDVIMSGLFRVAATGGEMTAVTTLDLPRGDNVHSWPAFLPDGVHYLYYIPSTDDARRGVYLGRLDRPSSNTGSPLFQSESSAVYVSLRDGRGAVLSVADGRVAVRRYDPDTNALSGDARLLDLRAASGTIVHPPMLSASPDVLAFAEGRIPYGSRMEAVDRNGQRLRFWDAAEPQNWPRVSRDGIRIARQRVDWISNNPDIWVEDLERGTQTRVTDAVEPDCQAVWSPDGRSLAYVSGLLPGRSGKAVVKVAAADGSGVVREFPCPSGYCEPTDWSDDGRFLLNVSTGQGSDVWTMSADDGKAHPLLNAAFDERDARWSPDSRWVAYVSRESGRAEVSVRAVAGAPERIVVSAGGGNQPVWRRDGGELFFVAPDGQLHSTTVTWRRDGAPRFGVPTAMKVPRVGFGHWGTQYDVSPDASRVYLMRAADDPSPRAIHVVLGWRRLLD
jgi:Tol biopolymer transport system component/tRNA A-37 threonylcarbamoyl transferase component Bud32